MLSVCAAAVRAQTGALTRHPHLIPVETNRLPTIPQLDSADIVFTQFCDEVEQNAIRIAGGKTASLSFYSYTGKKDDTLFTLAARCSIPYETIATLNALPGISAPLEGRKLMLPTVPGIFVFEKPESSLEILVTKKDAAVMEQNPDIWYTIHGRNCCFLLNERFSSTERAFFLDSSLRMPLDHYWLSSAYGMRISPISGNWKFHSGIDMAAPEGTPVYACKGGKVTVCRKNDPLFGNYIILQHSDGMTSVYAHLSKIFITAGKLVESGERIGLVGMTGAATGPHLHFEVRINGVSADPQKMLSK